jgi:hypothetical protein
MLKIKQVKNFKIKQMKVAVFRRFLRIRKCCLPTKLVKKPKTIFVGDFSAD